MSIRCLLETHVSLVRLAAGILTVQSNLVSHSVSFGSTLADFEHFQLAMQMCFPA